MSDTIDDMDVELDDIDLVGQTVAGRYRVIRRIGEGGMGVVYRAFDERLDKLMAVKVLKEDYSRRQDVVARFTQEAKSAARIKHENVLDVTDYGKTESGSYYIAMEFLVGSDLAGVLAGGGAMEAARAGGIAVQVCRALSAAHGTGVVHRDLKPENIFLLKSNDGREVVKIIDFGIAQMSDSTGYPTRRVTGQGAFLGTPEYMAPEQVRGGAIDHRADLYALGVVLFRMLAGRAPFWGENVVALKLASFPPAIREFNPDFHHDSLEWVVRRALVRDPDYRFQPGFRAQAALGAPDRHS